MNQEDKEKKQDEDKEEENESDKHPGEYFCGICGWVPISRFPNCH